MKNYKTYIKLVAIIMLVMSMIEVEVLYTTFLFNEESVLQQFGMNRSLIPFRIYAHLLIFFIATVVLVKSFKNKISN